MRERWAAIALELAEHVAAVSYDANSGRLTVCPESAAWATKLRLEQPRVIAAATVTSRRAGRSCTPCGSWRPARWWCPGRPTSIRSPSLLDDDRALPAPVAGPAGP
ncbi:DciA family protein, partial [Streptomyces sp. NPDC051172]|uniref:DciA family protein n=1 Tax=Streptomyces sp. NPDC051172 TaxID=3155796 RepID=UPI00344970D9